MSFTLDTGAVANLMHFVDQNIQVSGCDHTHRFAAKWASEQGVPWDELQDALEAQGAFCDCEVVLNLEEGPLVYAASAVPLENGNRWMLPPHFEPGSAAMTMKVIISRAGVAQNTHTKDGEWLVPATVDAKPRKRVRQLVQFFIGVESGMPTEVGVVSEIDPISISRYAHTIANSLSPELKGFGRNEAHFVLGKIANLADGTTVGTDIADRVGAGSKHRELTIHRVLIRRR